MQVMAHVGPVNFDKKHAALQAIKVACTTWLYPHMRYAADA